MWLLGLRGPLVCVVGFISLSTQPRHMFLSICWQTIMATPCAFAVVSVRAAKPDCVLYYFLTFLCTGTNSEQQQLCCNTKQVSCKFQEPWQAQSSDCKLSCKGCPQVLEKELSASWHFHEGRLASCGARAHGDL